MSDDIIGAFNETSMEVWCQDHLPDDLDAPDIVTVMSDDGWAIEVTDVCVVEGCANIIADSVGG